MDLRSLQLQLMILAKHLGLQAMDLRSLQLQLMILADYLCL